MSRKRRGFDIELTSGETPGETAGSDTTPAQTLAQTLDQTLVPRRGPMASAIHETAGSLRDRALVEAQIRAENDALAHEHVRLKRLGLITGLVPLHLIDAGKLTRDRAMGADPDLAELIASIRAIGLSNPIRVEVQPDGRHELVQGFRRLAAYAALLRDTGDADRYGTIPATILARGETLEQLYRQMVDENLVRKDISFAEMAQMAVHYAAESAIAEPDPARVVARLFGSVAYSKRSYIRRFITVMQALGPDLQHAPLIPRALGLALSERLEADPDLARRIRAALAVRGTRSAEEELDVLRRHAGRAGTDPDFDPDAAHDAARDAGSGPQRPRPGLPPPPPMPRLSPGTRLDPGPDTGPDTVAFEIAGPQGPVRCLAGNGRIELRAARDFSRIDRALLETAVTALLDRLEP